jgi:signal transduction histidine kinase
MQLTAEPGHVVQFYDTEEFLCARVADFLGDGLAGGEPIVVIASEARRQAFQSRLQARGLPADAFATGRAIWLDAHQTLAGLMVGAMPDGARFRDIIGGWITRSSGTGPTRRVRAYGEMVDILWRAGNVTAAIRLEEMWNDLAATHSFQLMCAYVMGNFYKAHDTELLNQVCSSHGRVLPAETTAAAVAAPASAPAVQALVAEIGQRQLVEEALRRSLRDLRASEERERATAARMSKLQAATARLATALSLEEVAASFLEVSHEVLGAVAAVLYLADGAGELRLVGARGLPATAARLPVLSLDTPLPLATAIRTGAPVWFESYAGLVEAYPGLTSSPTPAAQLQAAAALPLSHAGRSLGGFALSFEQARRFDEQERQWLNSLADQIALAVERVRLYQAEKKAVQELTETVRLSELLSGVLAHDLRNPLGAILTAAQVALMRVERQADGDVHKLAAPLARMLTSGRRMARMVDQLLDLSRMRLGVGMHLDVRAVDLHPVLAHVRDELADAHPGATLALEVTGDLQGRWDEDRLFQVFSNLAGNALVHGSGEGAVLIRAVGTDAEAVRVSVHNRGAVPAELMPRLFQPLARLEWRPDKSRGLGLGLFIVSQIVKAHGGTVEVESTEAAGTTFTVKLPRVIPGERQRDARVEHGQG